MSNKPPPTVRVLADALIEGVVHRRCPNCETLKPLDAFGLRRMKGAGEDGGVLVTNQSWCRECRNPGSIPSPRA